jgi:hypothetical protein
MARSERVAIPAGTSKIAQRTTIFPVSLPLIPDSAFPITSQQDLVDKLSKLLLRPLPTGQSSTRPAIKLTGK